MDRATRRRILNVGASAVALTIAGCLDDTSNDPAVDDPAVDEPFAVSSAIQYQDPNCACCGSYADYLTDHLEGDLETVDTDDIADVKAEYGIESAYQSCHTTDLDGTVIEGHVPADVIASAVADGVDGIALPGMPAGSPGMGGQKDETWTIYELGDDPDVYLER